METSGLAFIENAPANPMQLFTEWHNDAKEHIDPRLFFDTMTIASRSDTNELLNRNVILQKYDDNGLVFVTQRNSRKYKDFVKCPLIAATVLWIYLKNDTVVSRQIRVIGELEELSENEIAEFYKKQNLSSKIRGKICQCGKPVDWNELKMKHDQFYKDYLDGKETLPQDEFFTAMRIVPKELDFYYAHTGLIADRVKYTLDDGVWKNYHIAA